MPKFILAIVLSAMSTFAWAQYRTVDIKQAAQAMRGALPDAKCEYLPDGTASCAQQSGSLRMTAKADPQGLSFTWESRSPRDTAENETKAQSAAEKLFKAYGFSVAPETVDDLCKSESSGRKEIRNDEHVLVCRERSRDRSTLLMLRNNSF